MIVKRLNNLIQSESKMKHVVQGYLIKNIIKQSLI